MSVLFSFVHGRQSTVHRIANRSPIIICLATGKEAFTYVVFMLAMMPVKTLIQSNSMMETDMSGTSLPGGRRGSSDFGLPSRLK